MSRQSIQAGKAVIVVELAEKATFQFDKLTASLSSRMMAASRSLRTTALNATGGFLMTGLAVRSTLKDFMNFESQMLNLAAKMGYVGNVTAEETAVMKDLSQTIISIGRASAYTSQEVADAAISLAQAGFSAEELKGSLQGVIDLARGTNYALGESADFVANLVRTFEMFKNDDSLEQRTSKITSLTSQLVKSTRLGTIEIVDLREAFKYAGGTAKNLGVDVETMMGFFVQMSEAGLKASLAGTSINTMMLNLIRNVDLVKKKFPSFNIAMKDAGSIDLIATNRQLLALTQNMDVASRTSFFQDIFNIRGARAFTAALEIDRVEQFTDSIRNAGAESRLAAMKMESGAKGGLQRFLSAIEALNIALGELYSKEITATLNSLAFLVTQFEEVAKKHKVMVAAFLLSPGILAAMAVGSFALSMVLARLAVAMRAVTAAGRGLRFLGGTMLSSAQGMASLFSPKGPNRAAQIAAQTKAVARLNAQVTKMTASAMKKKTPAKQAKAMAAVNSSKAMQNLMAATQKLQALQASPRAGLLGWFDRFISLARQAGSIGRSAVNGIVSTTKAVIDRQKALKVNALMNSAIRGEQMLALRNEKNFVAQMAKVSTPLKRPARQVVPLPGISAARQGQLNAINGVLKNIAANEGRLARFAAMQERSYDRLYALRKQIAAISTPIDQIVGAKEGKRTPLTQAALKQQELARQAKLNALKAREARLVKIVNTNVGPQQSFFARQRLSTEAKMQKVIADGNKVAAIQQQRTQRALDAKQAAQVKSSQARQAATIARLDKAQASRRTASAMKIATLTSRLTAVKGLGATLFGGVGRGIMTFVQALRQIKLATVTAGMIRLGTGILALGRGFVTLAAATGRFVFSWNFVGMIFNVLLLFGDKIPFVVNAFSALGRGIGGAFKEIAKVGTYAAPALQLFQLAFNAFLQGDTATGITALQVGFQGLVSIIQNQLLAAWNKFMEHVGYMFLFLQKIFTVLKTIFMSIFSAISQVFKVLAAPIFSSIGDIFGAMSGGGDGTGFQTFITLFVQGLDGVFTKFAQTAITLNEYLMKFLAGFLDAVGTLVSYTPGTLQAGAAIKRDAATIASNAEMRSSIARGTLEAERKKRARELEAMMNKDSTAAAAKRGTAAENFNAQSRAMMNYMAQQVEIGQGQFMAKTSKRDAEMARLQQATTPSTAVAETAQQAQQKMIQQTSDALADVTARLDRASLQKRTASSAELKAMYDALPDMSTLAGQSADRYARLGQKGEFTSQQDVAALEQQKLMLQQQLAAMMDKSPYQSISQEMPKYLQALTGSAMSTRAIYRVDTKKQEDLLQQQLIQQEETNKLLRIGGGIQ
jgi:TP901 family phage tail tape measure protein